MKKASKNETGLKLSRLEMTTTGLRVALFDEINSLRDGSTTIQKANTIHKIAADIIEILGKKELTKPVKQPIIDAVKEEIVELELESIKELAEA